MDEKATGAAGSPEQAKPAEQAAKRTARGPAKSAAQDATAQAIREAARDFSTNLAGSFEKVFAEQNELLAQQLLQNGTDLALLRELLSERNSRQANDEVLRQEIEKKTVPGKRDGRGPRVIDAEPEQLRLALQFNALSSILGSRKYAGSQQNDSLIPSPEIWHDSGELTPPYLLRFIAPLPKFTETVVVKFIGRGETQWPASEVRDGYLGLDSDQVQYVEMLDDQDMPIALGIPFRR